jgi:hypothetical protein
VYVFPWWLDASIAPPFITQLSENAKPECEQVKHTVYGSSWPIIGLYAPVHRICERYELLQMRCGVVYVETNPCNMQQITGVVSTTKHEGRGARLSTDAPWQDMGKQHALGKLGHAANAM